MKFDPTSANNWNFTCKSPNHHFFIAKITKSPVFFEVNHYHHTFLESPNHQLFLVQITKSPFNFGLNHQSPKRLVPPLFSNRVAASPTSSFITVPKIELGTISDIVEEETVVKNEGTNQEVIDQEIPTEQMSEGATFLVNRLLARTKQPIRSVGRIFQMLQ